MTKKVIITGITGQDGAYLSKYLIQLGFIVIGFHQKNRILNKQNLRLLNIENKIDFFVGDINSIDDWMLLIKREHPIQIYHLAAQSLVWSSWQQPIETMETNIHSVLAIHESVRLTNNDIRIFTALSSEIFGYSSGDNVIDENCPLDPISPYAISKATDFWIINNYKKKYSLFTVSGLMFNHESILRPDFYVMKKIISTAFKIKSGEEKYLQLGNIDTKRDFGYAPEFVIAMNSMLSIKNPQNFVIATGESISIGEIVEHVFFELNISMSCLRIDKSLIREGEILSSIGCSEKAFHELGWDPIYKGKKLISKIIEDYKFYFS